MKKKYPKRGFASMSRSKAQRIQSLGGKASRLTHEQAVRIGRLGGLKRAALRRKIEKQERVVL